MKSLIFFLIVCLSSFCKHVISQPVAPTQRNKADSLMNEGDVPEAIVEYKRLYILNPKDKRIVYNYACTLSVDNSVIKQIESCFKYLKFAVELDTSVTGLTDPTLIPAREDKKWYVFENKLISMLNTKYNNPYKDIEYAKAVWRLGAYAQINGGNQNLIK
jgi:hypothetical protein